ncbi:unnamed protein product [Symbiodinium necroappetens]|uniref:PPM-type phosphatase domain-containing protein n=1 Tax=Symbiodinium necroappetens TaxID=1628268 RepID=A0A812LFS3_9DINO|nr:unnamed protein product [Symbiodinium necroappetens]
MAALLAAPTPAGQMPQYVCYLCTRKFADATALSTHEKYSQLHQQNLDRQDELIKQHKEEVMNSVHRLRQQLLEAMNSTNPVTSSRAGALESQLRQQLGEFGQAQEALEHRRAVRGADPARLARGAQADVKQPQLRPLYRELKVGHLTLELGAACWQGGKETNEDRFALDLELLSADGLPVPGVLVLDGHSGHRCVEHLAERLPKVLQMRLANKPNLTDEHLRDAVLEACALVDDEFLCWARQHEAMDGSTLLLALVYAEQGGAYRLLVANVGDSRAVLCRAAKEPSAQQQPLQACRLSEDHKPNRPDEQQRIEALGGVVDLYGVWRVFCPSQVFFGGRAIPRWGLAVSRAFGDLLLKEPQKYGCEQVRGGLVTAEPELRVVELDPAVDRFLVLACDGVWDVLQDSDAAAVCASAAGVELASHSLVRHAFAAGSGDNLTAVVMTWRCE